MSYIYDLTDTWNAGGTTFFGIKMNVTDSASASASKLISMQIGGSERFSVSKAGDGYFYGNVGIGTSSPSSYGRLSVNGNIVFGPLTRNQATTQSVGVWTTGDPADDARANIGFTTVAGAASSSSFITFATNNYGVSGGERMRIDSSGNVLIGTTTAGNGKVDILGNIDPGTTPAALSVRNTGIAGGTAAAQYGIKVNAHSYNNATASYGVYSFAYQNVGNDTYGVWGDAGSPTQVGGSLQPFYGVAGRAYFNSAASHTLTTGELPVGVYGTVASTGSTNTATSAAGYFTNAATFGAAAYGIYVNATSGPTSVFLARFDLGGTELVRIDSTGGVLSSGTGGIGYRTGAGGAVTQLTSRTTGVTLNKTNGAITLVSAAGTATWQSFTVTNSTVAATDVIKVCQKSGTDLYMIHVTNVAAGSFRITFATTGGTTTEQPVFNFAVIKAVTA